MKDARVQHLRDAIEGELNGLYVDYDVAQRIMQHIDASIADTAPPTYQDGYQDAWIEPCPNCGHVKGKELDNGEIK